MLDGPVEQIIDSTPMLGAAATQDTVRLVRHGVRKLLDAVAVGRRARPAGGWMTGLEFDYQRPEREAGLPLAREGRARADAHPGRRRTPSGRCGRSSSADGLLDDERGRRRAPAAARADRPGLRHRRGRRPAAASRHARRIGSSRRSIPRCATAARAQHQRFDGYKLSAAVTNTPEPLITAVDVAPASEQDGPQAKHLIDAQPRAAAAAAGAGRHRLRHRAGPRRARRARRRGARPGARGHGREGRLAKRDFQIDLDAGTVTCPAGRRAPIRTEPSGRRRARFAKASCDSMPAARALRRAEQGRQDGPARPRRGAADRLCVPKTRFASEPTLLTDWTFVSSQSTSIRSRI